MKKDGSSRLPALFTSRRNLLALLGFAPIAATAASDPALAARPATSVEGITFVHSLARQRAAWDAAEAALARADALHDAAWDRSAHLIETEENRTLFDEQRDAVWVACDAFDDLMKTPAPDLIAVRRKVALSIEHADVGELSNVLGDLDRMIGGAA